MMKNKIRILHVAQAAGGVDRYIQMLLKYLDKEKVENILVCSQDFHKDDYNGLVDYFEQIEMTRAIGGNDLKAIKEVRALIKKYNPDIVYAHSSKAGAIARVADIGLKNHCVCSYVSPADAQPGDLIFFEKTYNTVGASHVGIYVGNGMMIHCGDPISYTSINSTYWQSHFLGFGRIN